MEFHGVTKNGMVTESGHGESATCVLVPGDTAGRPWKTYVPTAQVHNYKPDFNLINQIELYRNQRNLSIKQMNITNKKL